MLAPSDGKTGAGPARRTGMLAYPTEMPQTARRKERAGRCRLTERPGTDRREEPVGRSHVADIRSRASRPGAPSRLLRAPAATPGDDLGRAPVHPYSIVHEV